MAVPNSSTSVEKWSSDRTSLKHIQIVSLGPFKINLSHLNRRFPYHGLAHKNSKNQAKLPISDLNQAVRDMFEWLLTLLNWDFPRNETLQRLIGPGWFGCSQHPKYKGGNLGKCKSQITNSIPKTCNDWLSIYGCHSQSFWLSLVPPIHPFWTSCDEGHDVGENLILFEWLVHGDSHFIGSSRTTNI